MNGRIRHIRSMENEDNEKHLQKQIKTMTLVCRILPI